MHFYCLVAFNLVPSAGETFANGDLVQMDLPPSVRSVSSLQEKSHPRAGCNRFRPTTLSSASVGGAVRVLNREFDIEKQKIMPEIEFTPDRPAEPGVVLLHKTADITCELTAFESK